MGYIQAIAALMGAAGDIADAQKQHTFEEHEARQNKELADTAAGQAMAKGRAAADQVRVTAQKMEGAQTVAYTASGVDAGVGTAKQVMGESKAYSEADAQTLENNAAREAWGFHQHGLKFMQQAELDAMAAKNRAGKSTLGAAAAVANAYATGNKGE